MKDAPGIRRNRQSIYIGEHLRRVLEGRKEKLSTVIEMLAERYLGLLGRAGRTPKMDFHADLYSNVLREVGRPLTSGEIATFPSMCVDWLKRHPEFPQGPGGTACMIVNNSSYLDLAALVEQTEKYNGTKP